MCAKFIRFITCWHDFMVLDSLTHTCITICNSQHCIIGSLWCVQFSDAILVNIICFATSIYAGIAVFFVIGYMANEYNVPVNKVITSGIFT